MGHIEGFRQFHCLKLVEVDGKVSIVGDLKVESCLVEGDSVAKEVEEEIKLCALAEDSELHKLVNPEDIKFETHVVEGTFTHFIMTH